MAFSDNEKAFHKIEILVVLKALFEQHIDAHSLLDYYFKRDKRKLIITLKITSENIETERRAISSLSIMVNSIFLSLI